jgi:hypothetical protein
VGALPLLGRGASDPSASPDHSRAACGLELDPRYSERRNGSPRRVTTTSAAPITNATTPAAAGLIPLPPVAGSPPAGWLVTVAANTTAAEVDPVDVVTGAGVDVEDDGAVAGVVVTASGGVLVDVVVRAVTQVSIVMKGPPTRPRLSPIVAHN